MIAAFVLLELCFEPLSPIACLILSTWFSVSLLLTHMAMRLLIALMAALANMLQGWLRVVEPRARVLFRSSCLK